MKKISELEVQPVLDLFRTFFRIGLFTFGGGYAMIPIIEYQCVEKKKWITHEEMMDAAVIAESTPGPIAINIATMVGWQQRGFWGALAATFGVVLPSFIIIYIISMFLDRFLEIAVVASAFRGIKIAVGLLIVHAGFNMMKKLKKDPLSLGILLSACAAMLAINLFSLNFSSVGLLLMAGVVSLAAFGLRQKGGGA